MTQKQIVIIGGVAGGASCAARARRLSEKAQIILLDKGPYVSFANCGLPYYVGDVIPREEDLLVATPELFKNWFAIDVRTRHLVTDIDPENRRIKVERTEYGDQYDLPYDALVLSPGAEPVRPGFAKDAPEGVFSLRNIPDARAILSWIKENDAKKAVVVGGGYIGLEMAENLKKRDLDVTIVEMEPQLMPAMDPEMTAPIQVEAKKRGMNLRLGSPVVDLSEVSPGKFRLELKSGEKLGADLVILALGVAPDVRLAKNAGLAISPRGGITVNEHMQTSDPHIWAVGDAVEVEHFVGRYRCCIPLAGPANRQGRIAADVILGKQPQSRYRGTQGTAVCGFFDRTGALTGLTEKNLKNMAKDGTRIDYSKIYIHMGDHAGYYPDASDMCLKLIYSTADGRILGGQAVGEKGVDKRMDVVATTIQHKGTVFDLEEAELCYAPQFGSAKDPVNMAAMVSSNHITGLCEPIHWEDLNGHGELVLDVRETDAFESGHVDGAINIPLARLRPRMNELPKDRPVRIYCQVGKRSYYAARILSQEGYDAKNISGGYLLYLFHEKLKECARPEPKDPFAF